MVTVVIHPDESPEVVQMLRDNGVEVIVAATVEPGSVVIDYESTAEALLSWPSNVYAFKINALDKIYDPGVIAANGHTGKRKAQWKQEVQRSRR